MMPSFNKCNRSELSNVAAISPFRHITWPMSVSIHDNGKIHRYNDIHEIAKTSISLSSSSTSSNSPSNGLAQNWYKYLP